jgi:hypothetical protein
MKKRTMIIAASTAVVSLGTVGVASASTPVSKVHTVAANFGQNGFVDPITSVLAKLVANGTITAAQSQAITTALAAARTSTPKPTISGTPWAGQGHGGPAGQGAPGFGGAFAGGRGGLGGGIFQQDQSVILSTLGITAATLQSDLQAGKSLATIAGTQTQALINALVAAETTAINAQVTAGKLTQTQATTMISGLTARITAEVNSTPGQGFHGRGPGAPTGTNTTPSTTSSNG